MFGCSQTIKNIHTAEELEEFMLDHGENIVDLLGSQIDRIERKLKVRIDATSPCIKSYLHVHNV